MKALALPPCDVRKESYSFSSGNPLLRTAQKKKLCSATLHARAEASTPWHHRYSQHSRPDFLNLTARNMHRHRHAYALRRMLTATPRWGLGRTCP